MASLSIEDYDPEGDNTENPDKLSRPHRRQGEHRLVAPSSTGRPRSATSRQGVGLEFELEEEATIVEIVSRSRAGRASCCRPCRSGGTAKLRHARRRVEPDHHPEHGHQQKAASGSPSWPRSPTSAGAWSCRRSASTNSLAGRIALHCSARAHARQRRCAPVGAGSASALPDREPGDPGEPQTTIDRSHHHDADAEEEPVRPPTTMRSR